MAYQKPEYIDASPTGDSVKTAILKTDANVDDIYWALNDLAAKIPGALQPQEMLDAIKTVDGAGSGLDADYLRGQGPEAFAAAVHGHDLVTQTSPGFMSAADKLKLDNIDEATDNMTGQEIVAALVACGCSGDGSGTDMDMLDGKHASEFALLNHDHLVATRTANGFMSAADKDKLDGIPPGGGQMTGQEIVAAIINDGAGGSGSGLDADKLDGYDHTAFSPYNHGHPVATDTDSGFMSSSDKTKLDDVVPSSYDVVLGTVPERSPSDGRIKAGYALSVYKTDNSGDFVNLAAYDGGGDYLSG